MGGRPPTDSPVSSAEHEEIVHHLIICEDCQGYARRECQEDGGFQSLREWLRTPSSHG